MSVWQTQLSLLKIHYNSSLHFFIQGFSSHVHACENKNIVIRVSLICLKEKYLGKLTKNNNFNKTFN